MDLINIKAYIYLKKLKILNGQVETYGAKGSSRFDVFDTGKNAAYDYKFTQNPLGLRQRQINKAIQNGSAETTLREINP